MADDKSTSPPQSIRARIAALKLDQVGRTREEGEDIRSVPLSRPNRAAPSVPSRPSQARADTPPQPPRPSVARPRPPTITRVHIANNALPRTNEVTASVPLDDEPGDGRGGESSSQGSVLRTSNVERSSISRPIPAPRLTPRKESAVSPPALPSRGTSKGDCESRLTARRASIESTSSGRSNLSAVSAISIGTGTTSSSRSPSCEATQGRVLAPTFDAVSLPPLPPKRTDADKLAAPKSLRAGRAPYKSSGSTPSQLKAGSPSQPTSHHSQPKIVGLPMLPPRLPSRFPSGQESPVIDPHMRRIPAPEIPPMMPKRSALSFCMNKEEQPPPIPLASRPDIDKIRATKPPAMTSPGPAPKRSQCLKCRDFTGPDDHAARFPRSSIPTASIDWLANALTSPFPSPTDQARVIFTWLHHNIDYDAESFFKGTIRPSTPAGTINSGLAVCEGYAGLFCALATAAGLEAKVVGGHGKGFGHNALTPGHSIPTFNGNHAWNAVKLPDNRPDIHQGWKLIDPCWGAGHLDGATKMYRRMFSPDQFSRSNVEFGRSHFPEDRRSFFREDGRTPSYEAYFLGDNADGAETPQIASLVPVRYGLRESSFTPSTRNVSTHGTAKIRFGFSKTCEHYNHLTMGPSPGRPYCFTLATQDGNEHWPLEYDESEGKWWVDLAASLLGNPGEQVQLNILTMLDGKDARGLTADGFRQAKGKKSMAWEGGAMWRLV